MSTSVKLTVNDKRKLEKLQALITLKTSKKITQEEILSKLISRATEKGDSFVINSFESTVPMSDESYEKVLSLVSDWKVETSWEDIDRLVYGGSMLQRRSKKRS